MKRLGMILTGLSVASVCWAGSPDKTPPVVDIVQPVNGATVGAPLLMTAKASDDRGVDHVECHVCGKLKGNCNGPQNGLYFYLYDPKDDFSGPCEYRMIAYDKAGNKGMDVVDIIIKGKTNTTQMVDKANVDVTGTTVQPPRYEPPPPTPAPFPVNPLAAEGNLQTTTGSTGAATTVQASSAASIKPRKLQQQGE